VSKSSDQDRPWAGRRLHFIAVGGAGMSGLALVAARLGAEVTGSDRSESSYLDRLRQAGLQPRVGNDPDKVPVEAEVIVSSAIAPENPELLRAGERGQSILHRADLLAELCQLKRLIAVSGAHGKTTTSGLLAHALRSTGNDPAFLVGGELLGTGGGATNAAWGDGEWIVAEADESDGSFLKLEPEIAVVTNIELDHHSHWSSEQSLREAFASFAGPARGLVLPAGLHLPGAQAGALSFGLAPELVASTGPSGRRRHDGPAFDVTADAIAPGAGRSSFTAVLPRALELEVELPLPGTHNVLNALAALAALHLVVDGDEARMRELASALSDFGGVARRLQPKGTRNGAKIVDDYAHHPTEVAAALAALSDPKPERLIAVFQPHLYSRTKALAGRFGSALALADEVIVVDVYPAREEPVGDLAGVSGRRVAEAVADRAGGKPVWWLADIAAAERVLAARLGEGDVLVTLGAGDVFELADRLSDSS